MVEWKEFGRNALENMCCKKYFSLFKKRLIWEKTQPPNILKSGWNFPRNECRLSRMSLERCFLKIFDDMQFSLNYLLKFLLQFTRITIFKRIIKEICVGLENAWNLNMFSKKHSWLVEDIKKDWVERERRSL